MPKLSLNKDTSSGKSLLKAKNYYLNKNYFLGNSILEKLSKLNYLSIDKLKINKNVFWGKFSEDKERIEFSFLKNKLSK